ncbi:MAG: hypothetical protein QXZ11_06475 [Thermoproteota archaeon]
MKQQLKFKNVFRGNNVIEKCPVEEKAARNLSRMIPASVEAVKNTRIAAARNSTPIFFFNLMLSACFISAC